MLIIRAIFVLLILSVANLGLQPLNAQDPLTGNANVPVNPRVKVTFDSITIHNDHDHFGLRPITCCSGEWTLFAFVHGVGIDLMRYRENIDDGDTIRFPAGTEVTVSIRRGLPLTILTIGSEDDSDFFSNCFYYGIPVPCGFCALGFANSHSAGIIEILRGPVSTWSDGLHEYQNVKSGGCDGEKLGFVNKIYDPPNYQAGPHTNVVSENGDFTLRYTITKLSAGDASATTATSCTKSIPTNGVTSSGNQPTYPPSNAIDNDPTTKWWSTLANNPYITLDIANPNQICGLQVAWADGNSHAYKFLISTSNDGINFSDVLSGVSSGTTAAFEKYIFQDLINAKHIKLTITQSISGSTSSIAQISELQALGTVVP